MSTIIQVHIEQCIQAHFTIDFMELLNESHMHAGSNPESHFKLTLVSADFNALNKVKRHQAVYRVLAEQMPQFHALALHTYTPEEWGLLGTVPASPNCTGGH